jgi:soluble lytic murein transglycosylase
MLRQLIISLFLCWILPALANVELEQQRQLYEQARAAVAASDWNVVAARRDELQDYPLALYLDYYRLESKLRHVASPQAVQFLEASASTPLQLRFKDKYLRRAGLDRRWQDFLAVSPTRPNDIELQCYYYRALLAQQGGAEAWSGAERLWNYRASRPEACDPLFSAWINAGKISDDIVWQRMLKAFDNRRSSLMSYAARHGSEEIERWHDVLLQVYRSPTRIERLELLPVESSYARDIASHGLRRLAGVDLDHAMRLWPRLQQRYTFSETDLRLSGAALADAILRQQATAHTDWLDHYLRGAGDDKMLERRLRWTLRESDWAAFVPLLDSLSPNAQQAAVWRYWRASVMAQAGAAEAAHEIWAELAQERHYYGFLAAEQVALAYSLNHKPLPPLLTASAPITEPGLQRATELMFHEQPVLAHSEWSYLLARSQTDRSEVLSQHANEQGWHRFAIDAANQAKAWDRLELRFPRPYPQLFDHYARTYNVTDTELMAIVRRESAFLPSARSHVGARGLMQLMPRTAESVARRLGDNTLSDDLYNVEANISLGGAYYRQLMDDYNDNRVFSLAAYNAGPNRVKRWRANTTQSMDVAQWVESIPFRETRDYVQAVLAYQVVYDGLRDKPTVLFKASELQEQY